MPSRFEDRLDRRRHVVVLARDEPRRHLDHRDPAAEAPVHLREFEADVAAADDDQVLAAGNRCPSCRCWSDRGRLPGPSDRGTVGRPPVLMKISRRLEQPSVDADRVRSLEAAVTLDQRHVRRLAQPARDALVGLANDVVLARLDAAMSTRDAAVDHDAEVGARARDVRGARAGDQRLRRDAADVDAGAAEALALEDRRLASRAGKPHGERGPAWPVPMTIASKRSVMADPPWSARSRVALRATAVTACRLASASAPAKPSTPSADVHLRRTGSWITTPSIGSTGARPRRALDHPPRVRVARLPARADAGRREVDVLRMILAVELRGNQPRDVHRRAAAPRRELLRLRRVARSSPAAAWRARG